MEHIWEFRTRIGARFMAPMRFFAANAILVATLLLVAPGTPAQISAEAGVAHRRAAHLRHGINLSEWFAQVYDQKGYTKEHFETWTTSADIALIKSAGFDHVRLSVNPQPLMDAAQRQGGTAEYFGY